MTIISKFQSTGYIKKLKDRFSDSRKILSFLDRIGQKYLEDFYESTPKDTGTTASSWGYEVREAKGVYELVFTNNNISDGIPIVFLIKYGHVSGNRLILGNDFITPILEKIKIEIRKEVDLL